MSNVLLFDKISTGTVCPFPLAFDPALVDTANVENLTVANCTVSYGEALDPLWAIFQGLLFIYFGLFSIPIVIVQLIRIKRFARAKRTPVRQTIQFKLYVVLLVYSVLMVVESIDIQGYRGWVTPYVYFIVDECIAVCSLLLGLLVVDFFGRAAEGSLTAKGIPTKMYVLIVSLSVCNFIGLETMGIIFHEKYFIFEAVKNYGSVVVAALVLIYSRRYAYTIIDLLTQQAASYAVANNSTTFSSRQSSFVTSKEAVSKQLSSLENQANMTPLQRKKARKAEQSYSCCSAIPYWWICTKISGKKIKAETVMAREPPAEMLKRRFKRFSAICIFVVVLYLMNGTLLLAEGEYEWKYLATDVVTVISLILIRIFYASCIGLILHLFPVPKLSGTGTGASNAASVEKLTVSKGDNTGSRF